MSKVHSSPSFVSQFLFSYIALIPFGIGLVFGLCLIVYLSFPLEGKIGEAEAMSVLLIPYISIQARCTMMQL